MKPKLENTMSITQQHFELQKIYMKVQMTVRLEKYIPIKKQLTLTIDFLIESKHKTMAPFSAEMK